MRRIVLAVVLAASLALVIVIAANAKSTSSNKSSATTLTVWTNSADPPAVSAVYTRFAKQFHVKLNIVKIPASAFETTTTTKWSSGARPDILEYHATSLFWALNPAKNLVDLSKMAFVKNSGALYNNVGRFDGKVYAAVTADPTLFGAFYNKAVLAKYGLAPPKTYADLANICSTLKTQDPSVVPIAEAGGSQWPLQILGGLSYLAGTEKTQHYSTQLLNKKASLANPSGPFVQGLEAYAKLNSNGCFGPNAATATFQDNEKAVVTGTAAMTFVHSGLISDFQTDAGGVAQADAAIGFASPSAKSNVVPWAPGPSGTWLVPQTGNAAKEALALKFVTWATGPDYQAYLNQSKDYPIIAGGKQAAGVSQLQKEVAAAYKNSSLAFNTNLPGFNSIFATIMSKLLAGQVTPQAAGQQSQLAFAQGAHAAHLKGW